MVVSPEQRKRREPFANKMSEVQRDYGTARALLARINSEIVPVHGAKAAIRKDTYSKALNCRIDPPELLRKWIVVEFSGGQIHIEPIQVPIFDMLAATLQDGGDAVAVISVLGDVIKACKTGVLDHHGLASLEPRLYALRAAAHRSLRQRDEAVRDYKAAVESANRLAPELVDRYRAGELAWHADLLHHRHTKIAKDNPAWIASASWRQGQRDTIRELDAILVKVERATPKDHRLEGALLKNIIRCTSRLDDEDAFMQYMLRGRKCEDFGPKEQNRKEHLVEWIKRDRDNDFAAAIAGKWLDIF